SLLYPAVAFEVFRQSCLGADNNRIGTKCNGENIANLSAAGIVQQQGRSSRCGRNLCYLRTSPGSSVMVDPVRQEIIALAHTVVVKVGTNVLTDATGRLEAGRVQSLADGLLRLREGGRKVALVSSGAIGAGLGRLNLGKRPTDL